MCILLQLLLLLVAMLLLLLGLETAAACDMLCISDVTIA